MADLKERRSLFWNCVIGATLSIAAGLMALEFPLFDGLARLSYDLPFIFQRRVPSELVLVYIDSKVKANLGQPTDQPLDRLFHTQLLDRLTQDRAKLILYDILFDTPHPEPQVDAAFAAALRHHGKVVLVADYIKSIQGNILQESPLPPISLLQEASAGWGVARLKPDPDNAIRQIDAGMEGVPSATSIAAALLVIGDLEGVQDRSRGLSGATPPVAVKNRLDPERVPEPMKSRTRWLNYYCAPVQLRAVDFDHALDSRGLPSGYFSNKLVVIGARPSVGPAGAQRDEFANPYSRFGSRFSSGAEVHALSLLNLMHGDWLEQLSPRSQLLLIILCGWILGAVLYLLRPWASMLSALAIVLAIFGSALFLQIQHHVWWSWSIPVCVQTPVAALWSLGWRYLVESRKRQRLRNAFSVYLSPYLADRIAQSDFDLSLGGQQVEATVLFTDLAGFTAMSEKLSPKEVSTILTTYFTRTTRHILERDGTIIKYMGDAVMAIWGAPLPNANHARDAVIAACNIISEGKTEIAGRRLQTRIGINTGPVLAGNLGSEFRFDYTAIGATTNLASRLEGLNKLLGTGILISESTHQALFGGASVPASLLLRRLGRFILSGTSEAVQVYEVLADVSANLPGSPDLPKWCTLFHEALDHWSRAEFPPAATLLQKVISLRGSHDGPSEFYLTQIQSAQSTFHPATAWTDVIKIGQK